MVLKAWVGNEENFHKGKLWAAEVVGRHSVAQHISSTTAVRQAASQWKTIVCTIYMGLKEQDTPGPTYHPAKICSAAAATLKRLTENPWLERKNN